MLLKTSPLISAEEILSELPVDRNTQLSIERNNQELRNIFSGKDRRKVMIIGPCSAYPAEDLFEFTKPFQEIQEQVKETIMMILRVYIYKPRTKLGWKGPGHQPNIYGEPNIEAGIRYCRNMMLEVVRMGIPIADEMLRVEMGEYFNDLLSYQAVGARSTEDAKHREFASALNVPVGMKNPTSGDVGIGVNGVVTAQSQHDFPHNGQRYETNGNPSAHLILRGGSDGPNYDEMDRASELMSRNKIANPQIVIDVSHDNSVDPETGKKDPLKQLDVLKYTADNYLDRSALRGWMIESHLKTGRQEMPKNPQDLIRGLSLTDACIAIDEVAPVILEIHNRLRGVRFSQWLMTGSQ
jgi:3-deoxy-7-phosphoheptulonate synthase